MQINIKGNYKKFAVIHLTAVYLVFLCLILFFAFERMGNRAAQILVITRIFIYIVVCFFIVFAIAGYVAMRSTVKKIKGDTEQQKSLKRLRKVVLSIMIPALIFNGQGLAVFIIETFFHLSGLEGIFLVLLIAPLFVGVNIVFMIMPFTFDARGFAK